jgi:hypothetical protein
MQVQRSVIGHNATQFGGTGSIDFIFTIEDDPIGGLPQWVAPYHLIATGTVNGQPFSQSFFVAPSPTPDPSATDSVINNLAGFPVGLFTLTLYDVNNVVVSSMASPLIFSPPNVIVTDQINPAGATLMVSMDFGLTTDYGMNIPGTPATISGIVPVTVTFNLSNGGAGNIIPNTTYHGRIKLTGSAGSVFYSPDFTFTTIVGTPIILPVVITGDINNFVG